MTQPGTDTNELHPPKRKRWISRWPGRLCLAFLIFVSIGIATRLPQFIAVEKIRRLGGHVGWGIGGGLPPIYRLGLNFLGTPRSVVMSGANVKSSDMWVFKYLPEVSFVDLEGTSVTGAGLSALNGERRIRHLVLVGNFKITDAGLEYLRLSELPQITALVLTLSPKIIGTGLTGHHDCPALRMLSVGACEKFSDQGLVATRRFTDLQALVVAGTSVTNSGLRNLTHLKKLRSIVLDDTGVTDDGLNVLSRVATLRDISLAHDRITTRGLRYLRNLKHLRYVRLTGDGITARDAKAILGAHVRVGLQEPPPDALLMGGN